GIVLTGYLDDGTAGLVAVQRCGGTCIVQDPADASYADMPLNALAQVDVDYCIPIAEMGSTLTRISQEKRGKNPAVPKDIRIEAKVAENVLSDLESVGALGKQVPFNCPGCGGVLWKMAAGKSLRYRCHTGHSYTAPVLLAEQTAKIEETLWIALRMLEERRNLLKTMAKFRVGKRRKGEKGESANRAIFATAGERADESEVHINRIRALLQAGEGTSDPKRQPDMN
ncbi:MAG TPA: chemotaxis protein CheB, partial [Candidatus Thermoplasmatota archaeon]